MKRLLLSAFLMLFTFCTWAAEYTQNGIRYQEIEYEGKTALEVIALTDGKYSGDIIIPDQVNGYSVVSIGMCAFMNCSSLVAVTIPNSVTSIGNSAFKGCSSLTSITIPEGVTNIEHYVFQDCTSLTTLVVAENNPIYDSRENCNAIIETSTNTLIAGCNNAFIPNTVTKIRDCAFSGCSSLISITIPNSVTSIGGAAFSGCSSLASITIPSSIIDIENNNPFSDCSSLTTIVVVGSNPKYDSRENCNAIIEKSTNTLVAGCKNTLIPNSVTKIGDFAFSGCSSLTSITIPNSVTSIGSFSFSGCTLLASITIPESVTRIGGSYTFSGCSSLTSISIPSSVTYIGWSAFNGCSSLSSISVDAGNTKYDSRNNCNAIIETESNTLIIGCKDTKIPNSVTSIGQDAFRSWHSLASITIPNSVTNIGEYAFFGCSALTSVTCKAMVPPTLGGYVFNDINKNAILYVPKGSKAAYEAAEQWRDFGKIVSIVEGSLNENITWTLTEDGMLTISGTGDMPDYSYDGGSPFYEYRSQIRNITIESGVTSIGEYVFNFCSSLASVTIPKSVTSIGEGAFEGCVSLTDITIPNSVTSIGSEVFSYCPSLTTLVVAGGNTKYDSRENCNAIIETSTNTLIAGCKNTLIPNSVTKIGDVAFMYCSSLVSITISNSVTSIGEGAFFGCVSLTDITIPNSVTSIGSEVFSYCPSLTTLVVAGGNTKYDSRENCNAIIETSTNTLIAGCKNTVIPNSVTSIGNFAFYVCSSLTSITIPNSVTSIGQHAFQGCSSLISVTCKAMTPPTLGSYVFKGINKNATLYVPKGSKAAYEAAEQWRDFGKIVSIVEGSLNENITWTLTEDGMLTISGTGDMPDYNSYGGSPFYKYRSQIKDITIEFGVTSIGKLVFPACSSLASIAIPESVTSIGMYAFDCCSSLASITVPESVTYIGILAFSDCSSLTSIVVTGGNPKYDSRENCNAIIETSTNTLIAGCKNTLIPNSVTKIGDVAFGSCPSLTSITIPNSVTSIGEYAFFDCPSLVSITIPYSVTNISSTSFFRCSSLSSISVDAGNTKYDSRDNCNAIILTYSNTLITGCKNTKIPESVTSIGMNAFDYCSSLEFITIPNSVTNIGYEAFRDCSVLTSVTCKAMVPPTLGSDVFYGINENATLYVPKGSKAAYEAANQWRDFANIEEIDRTVIISLGASNYSTYCSDENLDFSNVDGLKAYLASSFNPKTGTLKITNVDNVPAGEGILLKGTPDTQYEVPVTDDVTVVANLLKGTTTAITLTPTVGDKTNFVLTKNSEEVMGFYRFTGSVNMPANKAWLQIPTSAISGGAEEVRCFTFIEEGDELTGVADIAGSENNNGVIYDLNGRKLQSMPARGIVIVNGKKVVR